MSPIINKLNLNDLAWKRVQNSFVVLLNKLENDPVIFPPPAGSLHKDYLETADLLLKYRGNRELERLSVALKYRLEAINGGVSKKEVASEDFSQLNEAAAKWKMSQKIFWDGALSLQDQDYLARAGAYTEFVELLLRDSKLKEDFFLWIIRDRISPEVYIEFPNVAEEIRSNLLTGRIGTLGGDKLKVQKWLQGDSRFQTKIKVASLPFEGKDYNLLDMKQKVTFRGNYTLTIEEIFKLFQEKPRRFVNVEYFAQGITNWNAQHMGYWMENEEKYSVIDLNQHKWWRQLPPLEIMRTEEARERYGQFVNGQNWVVIAKSARLYLNMNVEKCHAYLEIAVPSSDGTYYVYDFGKFARLFPYGVVDNMRMFTITTPATVAYPDENIYHTARQQVGYAFEMHHYRGLMLMEEIRQDIERARSGNMIFQIEAENCGHWIQTHLEELFGKESVPNLFRAKLIRSEAQGALGGFFKFVRMLPAMYHTPMLMMIHYPFAPWRGQYVTDRNGERVFKALNKSSFWKDVIVYMPALLHHQYERGYISKNVPYDELEEAVEKTNSNILLVDRIKEQSKKI